MDAWKVRSSRKSVLDPGTFVVPDVIPEQPLDPSRYNNLFARHWRGEYSLGASYWWFGFLGNIAVSLIAVAIVAVFQTERGYDPKAILYTIASVWLTSGLVALWQTVGVWRSANRHIARRRLIGKRSPWAGLAKVAALLALLKFFAGFAFEWLASAGRNFAHGVPRRSGYSGVLNTGDEKRYRGGNHGRF